MKQPYKYIPFLLILIMGCTSTQTVTRKLSKEKFPLWKTDLKVLTFSGDLTTNYHGETNSGKCKMTIAGTDSLTMTIFGPFGITIGKLYARPNYFVFYNIFNSEVMEGVPNARNLKQAAMIPLSFQDLVRLVRCETPEIPEQFELKSGETPDNITLYENKTNLNYVETTSIDITDYSIKSYISKLKNGKTILSLQYSDYKNFDGFELAQKMKFYFPEIDGQINLDITDIEINKNINYKFSFKIPDSIKRIKMD